MAKFAIQFNPYVSHLTKPSKENALTIAGGGMMEFLENRDKDELRDLQMDDIEKKKRDDKKLAQFAASGMTMGAFAREHGAFETSGATMKADKIRKDRARERLEKNKFAWMQAGKPSASQGSSGAQTFNPKAFQSPGGTKENTKVPPAKTVTVYKDGKPVTYTVEG